MTPGTTTPTASLAASMNGALIFDEGIPGFPEAREFVLSEIERGGDFRIFQNLDDPDLAMVVAVPWLFFPEYSPELTDMEQSGLELESADDAMVFCSVAFDADGGYMNLLGPFIVNARTLRGRQIVLTDQDYPVRAVLPQG
jgi:flagellar assembly factor FliW